MEPTGTTDQVTVATGSARIDGIVADLPSASKAVVAVMDRRRGPGLRTGPPAALTRRGGAGPAHPAPRRLGRPAAPPARGGAPGGPPGGKGPGRPTPRAGP